MKRLYTLLSCAIFGFFIGCIIYLLPNSTIGHVCAPTIYDVINSQDVATSTKDNKYIMNPYTGEPLPSNTENKTPYLCVIDNSRNSRPQSGLSQADIVYDCTVEYGMPKFLALFYKNSPMKIGPIINAYPCFIDISKEYNIPFAHCGGSEEALATIAKDTTVNSINEISKGQYFWRDSSRRSPDNLYTSSTRIKSYLKDYNISSTSDCALTFNSLTWFDESLENATQLNFTLSSYYDTSYKFINGVYEKYMDGILATDLNDNTPLSFTNVVVQLTNIKSNSTNTKSNVNLIGSGEGLVFSNGKVEKMHWIKSNESSPTILTNSNGEILPLSPGNTIWHVADISTTISYK